MGRTNGGPARVVLQCRHRFFREGLASLLSVECDIDVVAATVTIDELLEVVTTNDVDVVLLDADGDATVIDELGEAAAQLQALRPGIRSVVMCSDARVARDVQRGGLAAVVTSADGADGVVRALTGDEIDLREIAPAPNGHAVLTPRETEVLGLIGDGHTTWEISGQLGISRKTVENHKQRIFAKLDVQNQAHAVAVAVRRGLIAVELDRPLAGEATP